MPARWLVKTEPTEYAYADLARERRVTWDGVSNALARIHLRAMSEGDEVLVYHTGKEKAVVGLARVSRGPRPDPAASSGASAGTKPASPKTQGVVVDFVPVAAAKQAVPLAAVRAEPRCKDLALVRLSRLSVMPVDDAAWAFLLGAAGLA